MVAICYSYHSKQHMSRTGFIISQKTKQLVADFNATDHCICYLHFKGRLLNFSLYSVYAPTEVSPDEDKKDFYSLLEKALDGSFQNNIK